MTPDVVDEADDEFVLPLEGFVCSYASPYRLIVRRRDSKEQAEILFGTRASDSQGLDKAIAALVARKASIVRAVATIRSTLRIDFDGGDSIEVPADPDFEAWEVRGPGDVVEIAQPGGG